jgi:hypothetical protein
MPLLRRAITVIRIVALWGMCMVVSPAGASLPTQDLSSLPTVHSLDPLQFGKISPPSTLFRSRLAQNVCVTIINHGAGTTKVRLFRDQKHIGEFLVKTREIIFYMLSSYVGRTSMHDRSLSGRMAYQKD